MTAVLGTQDREGGERLASPRRLVFQAAAALAMSMGIGRFAYTPILPLMRGQAGLSPHEGSELAVANYIGYLVGAIVLIASAVGTWRTAWLASAAAALLLTVVAWSLQLVPASGPEPLPKQDGSTAPRRAFALLFASYTLEGIGYIIAGTFLVAAINESSPGCMPVGHRPADGRLQHRPGSRTADRDAAPA